MNQSDVYEALKKKYEESEKSHLEKDKIIARLVAENQKFKSEPLPAPKLTRRAVPGIKPGPR